MLSVHGQRGKRYRYTRVKEVLAANTGKLKV